MSRNSLTLRCTVCTNISTSASTEFNILLESLENNSNFIVHEQAEEWEDDEKAPNLAPNEVFSIPGSVVSYTERLDDELTRSLQNIDPHTTEYIERLADEGVLYSAILRSQAYYERIAQHPSVRATESLNRVINRRLEHVYFKVLFLLSLPITCNFKS